MGDNFGAALNVILIHEGGSIFTDHPNDPGGATKYGVSLRFLKEHGLDLDGDGDIDADDVKGLTEVQSGKLYRQFFWNLVHGDDFVSYPVVLKLFDMAVNMGPSRAVRIAQESVGVTVDGGFGPQTFAALSKAEPRSLLTSICSSQAGFYRGLAAGNAKLAVFLNGWLVRAGCTAYSPCKTCLWKGVKPLREEGWQDVGAGR